MKCGQSATGFSRYYAHPADEAVREEVRSEIFDLCEQHPVPEAPLAET